MRKEKFKGRNVGMIDQITRVSVVGTILLLFYLQIISGVIATVLFGTAIYAFMTTLMAYCPVWEIFGISTASVKISKQKNKFK
jgi:hypothetical protein